MAIITSRRRWARAGPIGTALAERLGYRYVDHGADPGRRPSVRLAEEKLSHLDESKPSFFERFDTETRHYITVMQTTLLEFAEQDRVY